MFLLHFDDLQHLLDLAELRASNRRVVGYAPSCLELVIIAGYGHLRILPTLSLLAINLCIVMATNLASLLTASKALNSHLAKPDLPTVNLSLDQIEAQSRRLVSRQTGPGDDGRACVSFHLCFRVLFA